MTRGEKHPEPSYNDEVFKASVCETREGPDTTESIPIIIINRPIKTENLGINQK